MRCFGGKSCEISHSKSIWACILGEKIEKDAKWPNWPFWANQSHFFGKICHCVSFWAASVWNDSKSWRIQIICQCTPTPLQKQKILRFLQKWDALVVKDGKSCESGDIGHSKSIWASFWRKRWKNLQNDKNWPFGANLSHLFWQNSPLWVTFTTSVWNDLKKLKNSEKSWDSGEMYKFSSVLIHSITLLGLILTISQKNSFDHSTALLGLILTGSEKWALFWRSVKIPLRYLSSCWNWTKIAHFELIHATLVAKLAIVGHFEPLWCEMIQKSWKTQTICWCTPPYGMKIFWYFSKNETLWW